MTKNSWDYWQAQWLAIVLYQCKYESINLKWFSGKYVKLVELIERCSKDNKFDSSKLLGAIIDYCALHDPEKRGLKVLYSQITGEVQAEYHEHIIREALIKMACKACLDEIGLNGLDLYDNYPSVQTKIEAIKQTEQSDFTRLKEQLAKDVEQMLSTEEIKMPFSNLPIPRASMVIIGARPATGKTLFGLDLARIFYEQYKLKSLYVSTEMAPLQIYERLIKIHFNSGDFERGVSINFLDEMSYCYCPQPSEVIDMNRFERVVRNSKQEIVFVDYLTRMRTDDKLNSVDKASDISRRIKDIAVETGKVIIAFSQLNRQGANTKPTMNTLRDSGQVEQDADQIYMMHKEKDEPGIQFFMLKNRHGAICDDMTLYRDPQSLRYIKPKNYLPKKSSF